VAASLGLLAVADAQPVQQVGGRVPVGAQDEFQLFTANGISEIKIYMSFEVPHQVAKSTQFLLQADALITR